MPRLSTNHIDLYQTHFDDPHTPPEETLSTYGDLVKAGKVRAIGVSNLTAARLARFLKASQGSVPESVGGLPCVWGTRS